MKAFYLSLISLFALLTLTIFGHNNVAMAIQQSGAACHPANLQQAINRHLGWDQGGVHNNDTSLPFFVVCPLAGGDGGNTEWSAKYDFLRIVAISPTNRTIPCIFRAQIFDGSSFNMHSLSVVYSHPESVYGIYNAAIPVNADYSFGGHPNMTLVCSLEYGESILSYFIGNFSTDT